MKQATNPFFVRVRFEPALQVQGGKLAPPGKRGTEVHAASFLRQRLIILDEALRSDSAELKRIWLHEVFHFVWWRMSNEERIDWEALLLGEFRARAPGELGWSAECRKNRLSAKDLHERTRKWREYCCESFCDSAAWVSSGNTRHSEFTLVRNCRTARRRWLQLFLRYNAG